MKTSALTLLRTQTSAAIQQASLTVTQEDLFPGDWGTTK